MPAVADHADDFTPLLGNDEPRPLADRAFIGPIAARGGASDGGCNEAISCTWADTAPMPYGKAARVDGAGVRVRGDGFSVRDRGEGIAAVSYGGGGGAAGASLPYSVPVWGMLDECVEAATRSTCMEPVAVIGTEGTIRRKFQAKGLAGIKICQRYTRCYVALVLKRQPLRRDFQTHAT